MKMTLLLLLFGGLWTQEVNSQTLASTTMSQMSASRNSPISLVSYNTEAPNLNSVTSNPITTRDSEKGDGTRYQTSPLSSTPYTPKELSISGTSTAASSGFPVSEKDDGTRYQTSPLSSIPYTPNELSIPGTSIAASSGFPVTEPTTSQEVSTKKSSILLETLNETTSPVVPTMSSVDLHITTVGTRVPSFLETSSVTSGPPVTMATSSLETSKGTSGLSVAMTTISLKTPKGTSSSPSSAVKIPTGTTSNTSTIANSGELSNQGTNGTLLVAVLAALLVVIVLLILLVLWRRRQKRRTGILMLSRGGKCNGAVDAWAGPVQENDEEAMTATTRVSGGDKSSGVPEGEGSGRRPTLTTFFGRKKSHEGSLALEELKPGSASSLKGEEEPLVGSEDGAVEVPDSVGQK
ncbi:hypothetical protein HPG69_005203 [Diceros bicornis minor]|uniref:Leukosialin n=2 Tax=Diceros bicornis minor TaxID=77932 RepID=A0A7J7EGZ3_DICBM|nr:hypothetical protein HPG69_005203 [Diceros bicornis minor]